MHKISLIIFCLLNTLLCDASPYPQVEIKTSQGTIIAELYPEKAPKTVENFITYVKSGFYHNTIFHRVIPNFVVQGGGFDMNGVEKPVRPPIPNEADNGLLNVTGTLAMARGREPDSAAAQFFINLADNKHLNFYKKSRDYYGYCVFGKVIKGMDIVERIAQQPPKANDPDRENPSQPVVIEDIILVDQTEIAKPKKTSATKKHNASK